MSSIYFLSITLPAFLNASICSFGFRKVFCTLDPLNPVIVVPLTPKPEPSRSCPVGSMLVAIYFPILRVFVLYTQSSLAPVSYTHLTLPTNREV